MTTIADMVDILPNAADVLPWTASETVGYKAFRKVTVLGATHIMWSQGPRTTGATLDVAELANWTHWGQDKIPEFAGNTLIPYGFRVYASDGVRYRSYQNTTNHVTAATFSAAEQALWTADSIGSPASGTSALTVIGLGRDWQATTQLYMGEMRVISLNNARWLGRNTGGRVSRSTLDVTEVASWDLISQVPTLLSALTLPIVLPAGFVVDYNGDSWMTTAATTLTAASDFDTGPWTMLGPRPTTPKTITAATYTALNSDKYLILDATSNAINFTLPLTYPEGAPLTIKYTQTSNSLTITAGAGTTVVSPLTSQPVSSFIAPGTVGQVGTTQFIRLGTVWSNFG
jgi:hypothetical protein